MNPLRAATLGVSDLPAAIARYGDWLDYRMVDRSTLSPAIADALGAPAAGGAPYAVLRPASGREVDLRLIELPPTPDYVPMRTFGWAALEICIAEVHATHTRMAESPFTVIGPPAAIPGLPTIHPMQVEGPDGEIVFLTEIKQGGPGSGLPTAKAPIDTLFICVLACRDLPATAAWVAEQLGATIAPSMEIPYRTISRAFEMPESQRHEITTVDRGGDLFLELDQYPAAATARPCPAGQLPPGVSVVTLLHDNLDSVAGPWLAPPVHRDGAIYEGRRVGVLRMPEGALLELVESGA